MERPREIQCLQKVLSRMKRSYRNGTASLRERGGDATLTGVDISGLSDEYLFLKADESDIRFFSRGYGNRQCDYILLSERESEKVAVFVELKSSVRRKDARNEIPCPEDEDGYPGYVVQLKSSSCLFCFLHSVLHCFFACDELERYRRYYVVLHDLPVPWIDEEVPLTRPRSNDRPENAYVRKTRNSESIPLGCLIR